MDLIESTLNLCKGGIAASVVHMIGASLLAMMQRNARHQYTMFTCAAFSIVTFLFWLIASVAVIVFDIVLN